MLTANHFSPELSVANLIAFAVYGIRLPEPICAANAFSGSDITGCFFMESSDGNMQQLTKLGRQPHQQSCKAANGRTYEINWNLQVVK